MVAENGPVLLRWIHFNSRNHEVGVEFGAGRFNYTSTLATKRKIGVEIFQDYLEKYDAPGVEKVHGDMREWQSLGLPEFQVALFVDSLEHIPKQDGLRLLDSLADKTVLVYVPEGYWKQDDDPWGHGNPWQEHKSEWWPEDFRDFVITRWLHPGLRPPTLFAVRGDEKYFTSLTVIGENAETA
jgi:hypothetical protein